MEFKELYWVRDRNITVETLNEMGAEWITPIPESGLIQVELSKEMIEEIIPKDTQYCYTRDAISGKITYVCPFWDRIKQFPKQSNGHCHYLRSGDDSEGGLLWDMCKECGINDEP